MKPTSLKDLPCSLHGILVPIKLLIMEHLQINLQDSY